MGTPFKATTCVRYAVILACLLMVSAPAAGAAPILVNGSFEVGPPPFADHDIGIPAGSTDLTGWTIFAGGVDLLEDPWDVSDGVRAVDLDFRSPGGLEQAFATVPGGTYHLSFDLSGNPEGGSLLKHMRVSAGSVSDEFFFDSTGQTIDALLWTTIALSFEALGPLTTLRFESLSAPSSSFGALIDNIIVTVPEPGPLALFCIYGIAAMHYRRLLRGRIRFFSPRGSRHAN